MMDSGSDWSSSSSRRDFGFAGGGGGGEEFGGGGGGGGIMTMDSTFPFFASAVGVGGGCSSLPASGSSSAENSSLGSGESEKGNVPSPFGMAVGAEDGERWRRRLNEKNDVDDRKRTSVKTSAAGAEEVEEEEGGGGEENDDEDENYQQNSRPGIRGSIGSVDNFSARATTATTTASTIIDDDLQRAMETRPTLQDFFPSRKTLEERGGGGSGGGGENDNNGGGGGCWQCSSGCVSPSSESPKLKESPNKIVQPGGEATHDQQILWDGENLRKIVEGRRKKEEEDHQAKLFSIKGGKNDNNDCNHQQQSEIASNSSNSNNDQMTTATESLQRNRRPPPPLMSSGGNRTSTTSAANSSASTPCSSLSATAAAAAGGSNNNIFTYRHHNDESGQNFHHHNLLVVDDDEEEERIDQLLRKRNMEIQRQQSLGSSSNIFGEKMIANDEDDENNKNNNNDDEDVGGGGGSDCARSGFPGRGTVHNFDIGSYGHGSRTEHDSNSNNNNINDFNRFFGASQQVGNGGENNDDNEVGDEESESSLEAEIQELTYGASADRQRSERISNPSDEEDDEDDEEDEDEVVSFQISKSRDNDDGREVSSIFGLGRPLSEDDMRNSNANCCDDNNAAADENNNNVNDRCFNCTTTSTATSSSTRIGSSPRSTLSPSTLNGGATPNLNNSVNNNSNNNSNGIRVISIEINETPDTPDTLETENSNNNNAAAARNSPIRVIPYNKSNASCFNLQSPPPAPPIRMTFRQDNSNNTTNNNNNNNVDDGQNSEEGEVEGGGGGGGGDEGSSLGVDPVDARDEDFGKNFGEGDNGDDDDDDDDDDDIHIQLRSSRDQSNSESSSATGSFYFGTSALTPCDDDNDGAAKGEKNLSSSEGGNMSLFSLLGSKEAAAESEFDTTEFKDDSRLLKIVISSANPPAPSESLSSPHKSHPSLNNNVVSSRLFPSPKASLPPATTMTSPKQLSSSSPSFSKSKGTTTAAGSNDGLFFKSSPVSPQHTFSLGGGIVEPIVPEKTLSTTTSSSSVPTLSSSKPEHSPGRLTFSPIESPPTSFPFPQPVQSAPESGEERLSPSVIAAVRPVQPTAMTRRRPPPLGANIQSRLTLPDGTNPPLSDDAKISSKKIDEEKGFVSFAFGDDHDRRSSMNHNNNNNNNHAAKNNNNGGGGGFFDSFQSSKPIPTTTGRVVEQHMQNSSPPGFFSSFSSTNPLASLVPPTTSSSSSSHYQSNQNSHSPNSSPTRGTSFFDTVGRHSPSSSPWSLTGSRSPLHTIHEKFVDRNGAGGILLAAHGNDSSPSPSPPSPGGEDEDDEEEEEEEDGEEGEEKKKKKKKKSSGSRKSGQHELQVRIGIGGVQLHNHRVRSHLASHTLTVNRKTGLPMETHSLDALARSMSITSETIFSFHGKSKSFLAHLEADALSTRILSRLEDFSQNRYEWQPKEFLKNNDEMVRELVKQVKDILMEEPRLMTVAQPAYILGDLHGNFADLRAFGRAFWRQGSACCPANIVFLGDYVDRRTYSLEVVLYVFAQKLQAPHKVVLLRGNHELRDVNMMYGFLDECLSKFGAKKGQQIWEEINDAFDCLPVAAIVGNSALCVHGGIPGPECSTDINDILRIPCPLKSDSESVLARDLMWSDPQDTDCGRDFDTNDERGLSHKFSTRALERYLWKNDLDFVIRAHQYKIHLGFQVQKKARLITVFSSSAYCGRKNEASCVMFSDNTLRVMRLDALTDREMDRSLPRSRPGSEVGDGFPDALSDTTSLCSEDRESVAGKPVRVCEWCEEKSAVAECSVCSLIFCSLCSSVVHSKGSLKEHELSWL